MGFQQIVSALTGPQPAHVRTVTSKHIVSRAEDGQLINDNTYDVEDTRPFTSAANAVNHSLNLLRGADTPKIISNHELSTRTNNTKAMNKRAKLAATSM